MELKYIIMTIIKILISVPSILLVINDSKAQAAALMGGYLDNNSNSTNLSNFTQSSSYETFDDDQDSDWQPSLPSSNFSNYQKESLSDVDLEARVEPDQEEEVEEEKIPDPSALVVPGYNLPENIFNKGKPFYLEKDPLTGKVDFDSRTSLLNVDDDEFDYVEEEELDPKLYEKANIDRKDGNIGSHKASDVNQLTPNFHDFLNLPVKYNPDKYVYPLISSSYANTKVQGNLHKYQTLNNHKNYVVTTYKPTVSPNYYHTLKTPYYDPNTPSDNNKIRSTTTTTPRPTTTTTTTAATTTTTTTTTKSPNLMDSAMNHHPIFGDFTTQRPGPSEIYITTKGINDVYLTTKKYSAPATTKRPLSLFEQFFGEYEDEYAITSTEKLKKPPPLFQNLPANKNKNKYDYPEYDEENTAKPERPQENNILSGTGMGHESAYEYEDDYGNVPSESNTVYQTKPVKFEIRATPPASISKTTTLATKPTTTITTTTTKPTPTTTTTRRTTTTITTITTPKPSSTTSEYFDSSLPDNIEYEEYEQEEKVDKKPQTSTEITTSTKVTSLPLGENHFGTPDFRPPIIAMTHDLKGQLNKEKVITSASNIRIPPEQDSVSFVVGNHQTVGGGGGFVGSAFKEGPFDNSPFRPLIVKPDNDKDTVTYTVEARPEFVNKPIFSQNFPEVNKPQPKIPEAVGSSINIQPIKTSEASLSIGVPINGIMRVPGQVVDENLENEKIEFPKQGTGAKIVFPDDKEVKHSTYTPDLQPPPPPPQLPPNREVLQLNSKPMYHQLPSDLTPPSEQDLPLPHLERPRPPWDPRPGHFYNGRPEYIRPPRPQPKPGPGEIYKRIDNLPNILPQFRPNAKISSGPHYFDHFSSMKNGYLRQPLLERPSNRPVGFFEKLVPPPPPKNLHNLRKVPILEQELRLKSPSDEAANIRKHEQYEFYQHQTPPPQPVLINRRKSEEPAIETLQMIQAKQVEKKEIVKNAQMSTFKTNLKGKDTTEKPLYVVYPVNSAPIKLDALDSNKKETVVVGTRAELPLPPSKINQEFNYESPKDRNDAPILKPHPKPSNFPIKSDFPYPLERPDITSVASTFPSGNNLEIKEDSKFASNNQWGAVQDTESRILTGVNKINYKNPNQISVTLKTYTEKPIAVAYTPTEPYRRSDNTEKYSMPNYASPVISEIRPSGLMDKGGSEITVSAVMHTHPQMDHSSSQSINGKPTYENHRYENHKTETDEMPTKLDFQAPFQASLNIDGISQGWTVVRNNNEKVDRSDQDEETTTAAIATTGEFDMKNFKPQFFSGFKPIYNYPDDVVKASEETEYGDREERKV